MQEKDGHRPAHALLAPLVEGPSAYVPVSGWPIWAAVGATVAIFAAGALAAEFAVRAYDSAAGAIWGPGSSGALEADKTLHLAIWLASMQVVMTGLTMAAAGLFSNRKDTLALRPPVPGFRVLPAALLCMFAGVAIWTGFVLLWDRTALIGDLRPFQEFIRSPAGGWAMLLVMGIGAPVSEELLFRGFLFSALAKSRFGLLGASLATSAVWTSLHLGYSIYGLIEVFAIGLFLAWLLVRTGSLWITIICHMAYNTAVSLVLAVVPLPV